jgi:hypothetical protein
MVSSPKISAISNVEIQTGQTERLPNKGRIFRVVTGVVGVGEVRMLCSVVRVAPVETAMAERE